MLRPFRRKPPCPGARISNPLQSLPYRIAIVAARAGVFTSGLDLHPCVLHSALHRSTSPLFVVASSSSLRGRNRRTHAQSMRPVSEHTRRHRRLAQDRALVTLPVKAPEIDDTNPLPTIKLDQMRCRLRRVERKL